MTPIPSTRARRRKEQAPGRPQVARWMPRTTWDTPRKLDGGCPSAATRDPHERSP